jgi:leucyl/phenylalanyl-tRNA--protein transferase
MAAGGPRVDPGPCRWQLPDPGRAPAGEDVVGVGADLEPSTILAAYAHGMFPMEVADGRLGWWSPDPRGVLDPGQVHVSRSLRRSLRVFTVTVDAAFGRVIRACRDARPGEVWITDAFVDAYEHLHELGWAHSVEVWQDGSLAGGLYGLELGGLFAAESKFHRVTDASKAAVVALAGMLAAAGPDRLIDVQWRTDHLATLGVVAVPRADYLARLPGLLGMRPAL